MIEKIINLIDKTIDNEEVKQFIEKKRTKISEERYNLGKG